MNEEIVPVAWSEEKIALIKKTVAKGTTDDELELFLYTCKRTGLDPLTRQIYCIKRKTKDGEQMTIQTGIDGYRAVADRTGKYAGNDDPIFDNEDDPGKATVTVYKIVDGQKCAFTSSARWSQYYPGTSQGWAWDKMPHLMLGKCAEALALRKAFPSQLSGLYTKEEMDQAGDEVDVKSSQQTAQAKIPYKKMEVIEGVEVWDLMEVNEVRDHQLADGKMYYIITFADDKRSCGTIDKELADRAKLARDEAGLVKVEVRPGRKPNTFVLQKILAAAEPANKEE